jgi:hypothetical protein
LDEVRQEVAKPVLKIKNKIQKYSGWKNPEFLLKVKCTFEVYLQQILKRKTGDQI